jgi:hypothetical protein
MVDWFCLYCAPGVLCLRLWVPSTPHRPTWLMCPCSGSGCSKSHHAVPDGRPVGETAAQADTTTLQFVPAWHCQGCYTALPAVDTARVKLAALLLYIEVIVCQPHVRHGQCPLISGHLHHDFVTECTTILFVLLQEAPSPSCRVDLLKPLTCTKLYVLTSANPVAEVLIHLACTCICIWVWWLHQVSHNQGSRVRGFMAGGRTVHVSQQQICLLLFAKRFAAQLRGSWQMAPLAWVEPVVAQH